MITHALGACADHHAVVGGAWRSGLGAVRASLWGASPLEETPQLGFTRTHGKNTKGYGYQDKDVTSNGIFKLGFADGVATKGKAGVQGKNNASKSQTSLPTGVFGKLTGNTTPTIQMVTSDGFCATATMNIIKKDVASRYFAQLK